MRICSGILVCFLWFVQSIAFVVAANTPLPLAGDIASKYDSYLNDIVPVSYNFKSIIDSNWSGTLRFNGKQVWSKVYVSEARYTETLWENGKAIRVYGRDFDTPDMEFTVVSSVSSIPEDNQTAFSLFHSASFGYVITRQDAFIYIPDWLHSLPKNQAAKLSINDGTQYFRFDGIKDGIAWNLYFDNDWMLKKIEYKKISSSLQSGEMTSCEIELGSFVALNQELSFPTIYKEHSSAVVSQEVIHNGKRQWEPVVSTNERVDILSQVVLHSVSQTGHFAIDSQIPNGTTVYMQDAPQIQYVWMDGKAVVLTDEVALRIARGNHGFMPGPKEPRFWFIFFGIVLMAAGLTLKIRDMLAKK